MLHAVDCKCRQDGPHLQPTAVAKLLQRRSAAGAIVVEIIRRVLGRHGSEHLPHLPGVRTWPMCVLGRAMPCSCCEYVIVPVRLSVLSLWRSESLIHLLGGASLDLPCCEVLTRVPATRCAAAAPARLCSIETRERCQSIFEPCNAHTCYCCNNQLLSQSTRCRRRGWSEVHARCLIVGHGYNVSAC